MTNKNKLKKLRRQSGDAKLLVFSKNVLIGSYSPLSRLSLALGNYISVFPVMFSVLLFFFSCFN